MLYLLLVLEWTAPIMPTTWRMVKTKAWTRQDWKSERPTTETECSEKSWSLAM